MEHDKPGPLIPGNAAGDAKGWSDSVEKSVVTRMAPTSFILTFQEKQRNGLNPPKNPFSCYFPFHGEFDLFPSCCKESRQICVGAIKYERLSLTLHTLVHPVECVPTCQA